MNELVLSLFPGLDMLGMAFEQEGYCVVAGPDVIWGRDVRDFHPPAGKFEGVIGGPPCQSFSSLAHLVRAKGLEPRFGNLIPEFVRCVEEASPRWFLMENTPLVPEDVWPEPEGFSTHCFLLDNCWLDAGDGFGQEQMRKRRIWFGWRKEFGDAPNLMRWIRLAAFDLPKASVTVSGGNGHAPGQRDRVRRQAITHRPEAVPVKMGGSGKVKHTATGAHTCKERPKGGHGERYKLGEMLRLQGLEEDCLDEAPFTMQGKRKLIGNGVPIPMGRALAKAVRAANADSRGAIPAQRR